MWQPVLFTIYRIDTTPVTIFWTRSRRLGLCDTRSEPPEKGSPNLSNGCVAKLPDTPLDIIGDIHGELEALESLLEKLGYDASGHHPNGRRLVFVGDLIDRGPDSPGVLRAVMRLVESGQAQCITGNHELNAVRDEPNKYRSGEGWWYGRIEAEYECKLVDPDEKERTFLPFLQALPAALERDDLRVIHACWYEPSVEKLRTATRVIDAFKEEEEANEPKLDGFRRALRAYIDNSTLSPSSIRDPEKKLPLIPELARLDEANQMGNAVKIATSGMERVADDSFWASGKWRMVNRVPWWEEYSGPPVVVGHYWRRYDPEHTASVQTADADVFGRTPPGQTLGPDGDVMCIDYSVGMRYAERTRAAKSTDSSARTHTTQFNGCLAALRVPEWQLVFDDDRESLHVDRR